MSEIVKFTDTDFENFAEFSADAKSGDETMVKSARLFYVGEHKGRKYSSSDLEKIAGNFDPSDQIPVQLDHSPSARDTVGILKAVRLSDDRKELHGDLEFLGRENVDKVRLGLWKKVSVGLSLKQPDMRLQEVSITPFPALRNAKINHADNGDNKEKEAKAKMSDSENIVNMAEFSELKEKFAKAEMRAQEAENKLRFAEDKQHIDKFVQDGKITQSTYQDELDLYHSLDEKQREKFNRIKEAQPAKVDFKTYNNREITKPGEMSDDEAKKEAQDIAKGISYFNE